MTRPLEFHPSVRHEIADARRWYERQQPGLGASFRDAVKAVFLAIAANPARFGFVSCDIREGQLDRFPYAVYYRVLPNAVRVLAVFHAKRNPSEWQSRT